MLNVRVRTGEGGLPPGTIYITRTGPAVVDCLLRFWPVSIGILHNIRIVTTELPIMDRLSPELVQEILRYIPLKSDLSNFRLVQYSFAQLGQQHLFRSINIQPSKHSLCRFVELSRKANLAHHIREVVLNVDNLKSRLWDPFTKRLESEDLRQGDRAQVGRATALFHTMVDACNAFHKSPEYLILVSAAFVNLPRLNSLRLEQHSDAPLHWRIKMIETYYTNTAQPHMHFTSHLARRDLEYDLGFQVLINAAYQTDRRLLSFRAENRGISRAAFRDPELVRRTAAVFRNCRYLDLKFPVYQAGSGVSPIAIISPAVGLKTLIVRLDGLNTAFDVFAHGHVWPRLHSLFLSDISGLHENDIIEFLGLHRTVLRHFLVRECGLAEGGCWAKVLRFATDTLTLTRLGFSEVYEGDEGETVECPELKETTGWCEMDKIFQEQDPEETVKYCEPPKR